MEDEALSAIPIVALSSDAMEEDRQKSLQAGMNEHFSKPIDIEALQEMIQKILEDTGHEY